MRRINTLFHVFPDPRFFKNYPTTGFRNPYHFFDLVFIIRVLF